MIKSTVKRCPVCVEALLTGKTKGLMVFIVFFSFIYFFQSWEVVQRHFPCCNCEEKVGTKVYRLAGSPPRNVKEFIEGALKTLQMGIVEKESVTMRFRKTATGSANCARESLEEMQEPQQEVGMWYMEGYHRAWKKVLLLRTGSLTGNSLDRQALSRCS